MSAYVAFLRGINVGGNKTVAMSTLKTVFEALGFATVRTHLNSGNVVFGSDRRDRAELKRSIEAAIEHKFGFCPAVMLRSAAELRGLIANNPFPAAAREDPSHLLVMFLAGAPATDARARIAQVYSGPEEITIDGEDVYLTYPNGIGRSKLTNAVLEKQLGVAGTARNWNTLVKLIEIAEAARQAEPRT